MDQEAGALIANLSTERWALQIAIAVAGIVPVGAGALGALDPGLLDLVGRPQTLTHISYLSGLLLGIGLVAWSCIPAIETKVGRLTLLTFIVVVGGLARLLAAIRLGIWTPWVFGPLVMELGVTPALWLWLRRLTR